MSAGILKKAGQNSAELRIGGLARLSACDWPDQLVATVFCQGCPWKCSYCHNPHLIAARGPDQIPWGDVLSFLDSRRTLLDGVVFSGGEPTLQAALPEAMRAARALGLGIGLHTAGPYPERLDAILPLVDWIGFDVKAPFDDYARITGVTGSGKQAKDSLLRVLASGVSCEVRTTVHPSLLERKTVVRLTAELAALGVSHHKLQAFRATGCATPELTS